MTGEGDGTVSLLSAGYMCAKGWKMKRYNPARIPVKIYEMPHQPDMFGVRLAFFKFISYGVKY